MSKSDKVLSFFVAMQGNQPCMAEGAYPKSFPKRKDFYGLAHFCALSVIGLAVALDEEDAVAEEFIGHL